MSEDEPVPYNEYGPDPRYLADDRKRGILRTSEEVFELPDVTSHQPVIALASQSMSAAYATGGDAANPALPSVPTRQRVDVMGKGGYTFEYVAGDKVKAYTTAGAEVAAATDLTALNPLSVTVWGTRPTSHDFVRADGSWSLSAVRISVASALTFNGSNYWTIRAQIVRAVNGAIDEVGKLSTAAKSLVPSVRYDVFAAGGPATVANLRKNDLLRVRFEETGTAPALVEPVISVRRRRQ